MASVPVCPQKHIPSAHGMTAAVGSLWNVAWEGAAESEEDGAEQSVDSDAASSCSLEDGICDCCGKAGKVQVEPGETLDQEWWDTRFQRDVNDDTVSEWVMDYGGIANFMLPALDPSRRTLVVGCGNSAFSEKLCAEAGFVDIVNTDISPVVIEHMRAKHAKNTSMRWVVDDACRMAFGDAYFDQIADKSLLDCMCHCDHPQFQGCVTLFLRECHRVLRPGGVAVFATKQAQDVLEKYFACDGPREHRWCDLDWTISRQIVFAPKDDSAQSAPTTKNVAVADTSLLPPGCKDFDSILVFTAVKGRKRPVANTE